MNKFLKRKMQGVYIVIILSALCSICFANDIPADVTPLIPPNDLQGEIENSMRKAAELISKRSYRDAEKILLGIEQHDVASKFKVYFLLGRLYKDEGSFDKAESFLTKSADGSPLLKDYALKLLADTYASAGKFEGVIVTVRQIKNSLLLQYSKQAEIKALLSLKRDKDAMDILSHYVKEYPKDWDHKLTLAMLINKSGETPKAISLLKEIYINAVPVSNDALQELKLLNADSFSKDEILKRADSLYEKNNFQRAEKEYQGAIKLATEKEKERITFSIGMCQFRLKQYTNASRTFGSIKTSEALYWQGWAYHRIDDREEFSKVKKAFKANYPGDERFALLLLMEADEFRRQGKREEAENNFKEVIKSYPGKTEDALWGIGWMNYVSGDHNKALQYFSQLAAYEKSDNYYKYLYWKGRAHENVAGKCSKHNVSMQVNDQGRCDGQGSGFFNGFPSDRSFYGYLIKFRSSSNVLPEKIDLLRPSKPMGETYDRIEALALLGMKDEAVDEIVSFLRLNKNKNDILYLGRIAMELGEYRKIIALTEKKEDIDYFHYSFPVGFGDIIEKAAESQDVDKYLVAAVIREESRFDPNAVSWAGAIGLMQLMPATAYRLKKDMELQLEDRSDIHDVRKNILLGSYYLSMLLKEFGEIPFALAAYNAGENALKRWLGRYNRDDLIEFIENIPYRETRFYVKRVLRSYWQYRSIHGLSPGISQIISRGDS